MALKGRFKQLILENLDKNCDDIFDDKKDDFLKN
jgi:hypothetical protein